jgi:3-O-methylgallate 3,4-dioxygenase
MARIVLGMATSHTPMLNAPPTDWPRFIERDSRRPDLLDVEGRLTTYEAQLRHAPSDIMEQIAPERMRARHRAVEGAIGRLAEYLGNAELDALIVVGDDQDELYHYDNMPGILVYYGETIPNVPLGPGFKGPDWARRATARWFEEKEPRDYPVDTALARHLIDVLIEREFDVAASKRVPDGEGEGHAIGFVHKRLMQEIVPIVPVCINTY